MAKRTGLLALVMIALVFFPVQGFSEDFNFVSRTQVDLPILLAPAPSNSSAQTQSEIAEIIQIQKMRSPLEEATAVSDNELSVFRLASDVLGPRFKPENLPLTAKFFQRLKSDLGQIVHAGKDCWNRPRPYALSPEIKSCFGVVPEGSYPSGHSTFGFMSAVVLSGMVPEKKAEIFDRAAQYGRSRMVCGVHYHSDIDAGRIAGTAAAAFAMQDPDFRKEFEGAKKEIRTTLGLE